MEDKKHHILDLFPIPLYVFTLPSNFSSIVGFLDSQEMVNKEGEREYGKRSVDSYILNNFECSEVSKYILDEAQNFGTNYLSYASVPYKFTQSWISHKHPGQSHIQHTHNNSIISGVLYYGEHKKDTPSINFHKEKVSGNQGTLVPPSPENVKATPYSATVLSMAPEPGLVILFPSYLPHSVPENKTNIIRKSLAFNIIPAKGLGNEDDLSELKF